MKKNTTRLCLALLTLSSLTACNDFDTVEPLAPLDFKQCLGEKNARPGEVLTYPTPTFNKSKSCKIDVNATSCNLVFGYKNPYSTQNYAIGSNNFFSFPSGGGTGCSGNSGSSGNCGQITRFEGNTTDDDSFTTKVLKAGNYKWTVKGAPVTGSCDTSLTLCKVSLPVTLVRFDAKWDHNRKIDVKWTTSSESNNQGFIIQVIKPCTNEKIDILNVAAKSTPDSNKDQTYSESFAVSEGGIYYVNLIQIDLDGKRTTHKMVDVIVGNK